jgi:hypothetical protein
MKKNARAQNNLLTLDHRTGIHFDSKKILSARNIESSGSPSVKFELPTEEKL